MMIGYWTGHPSTKGIAKPSPEQAYDAERKGILLAEMKRYLEDIGLRAFTLRGGWLDIENHLAKGRPIIVGLKKPGSWDLHFAVVVRTADNQVWLNDPTRKKSSMKLVEFVRQWKLADNWMLLATP